MYQQREQIQFTSELRIQMEKNVTVWCELLVVIDIFPES